MSDLPQVGSVIELDASDQPYGPDAIGRLDGLVVFVDAVPGDRVRARVTEVHPRFVRAVTTEVLAASPHRVAPECAVAGRCGGCQWQAMDYPRQLAAKQQAVHDALERIGGWQEPPMQPIVASPRIRRYRNKARYSIAAAAGTVRAGYAGRRSHEIIPIRRCPLNMDGIDAALDAAIGLANEARWGSVAASLRSLAARESLDTGEVVVRVAVEREMDLRPFANALVESCGRVTGVTGVTADRRGRERLLRGEGRLTECVGPWRYRVSASSFFQVNPYATSALVEAVREATALAGGEHVLDAYGGVGLFSVALAGRRAPQTARITLVEADPGAVADARRVLRAAAVETATVVREDVARFSWRLGADAGADVVVCDPPREGAGRAALTAMDSPRTRRFVYVACDPTSLARDSALLRGMGYRLRWARPLDLFPHTYHVETVALLERP